LRDRSSDPLAIAGRIGWKAEAEEIIVMFDQFSIGRRVGRGMVAAGALTVAATLASPVLAGECPMDQRKANVREAVNLPGVGVTDTVLAAIDLANEPIKANGRQMRVRKLVIEPNGVVPWHSHNDRPALIYVVEGEIVEYASNCTVPILHKAGEVSRETFGTSHWWKNTGQKTVTLLSFDILHDPQDKHM